MTFSFELRYIEVDGDIVSDEYPHILRLVCLDSRQAAMTTEEYRKIRRLCDELIEDRDYFGISRPQFFVAFRTKAQAMQIKLMWSPIEYTRIS